MKDIQSVSYIYSLLRILDNDLGKLKDTPEIEHILTKKLSIMGFDYSIYSSQYDKISTNISNHKNSHQLNNLPLIKYVDNSLKIELPLLEKSLIIKLSIPQDSFSKYISKAFSPKKFTPSEVRTIMQFLADADLAQAALNDCVSLETKKSHYKSAATKMGISKQALMVSTLFSSILMELSYSSLATTQNRNNSAFLEYSQRYLPNNTRQLILLDATGQKHRLLDMGSITSKPVIILPSLVLPDFLAKDIQYLIESDLRLLVPLQYGTLSPNDPILDVSLQLDHNIRGIELIRKMFCGNQVDIVSLITSAWYGIAYAERFPERLNSLIFVGGCYRQNTTDKVSKKALKALTSLTTKNDFFIDNILLFAKEHFRNPKRFSSMLKQKYIECQPDSVVINQETEPSKLGDRYYFMLSNSLASLRHDFQQQYHIKWEKLSNLRAPIHFIHGAEDRHTHCDDIESLVRYKLPSAKVHKIPECGQLMYYNHFKTLIDKLKQIYLQS